MPSYSIYLAIPDIETLDKHKPEGTTVTQFATQILHQKAEALRASFSADGTPMVPQHERT